ncbi:MAG: copper amine oxidase N-terminal domain-containing protein [Anaerovoracaceae bacterium]
MKKKMIVSLLLTSLLVSTSAVFAAEPAEKSNANAVVEPISAVEPIGVPQITVDGTAVDLEKTGLSQYMFEENGKVMVPVRAVAEAMGFQVEWNAQDKSVSVADDEWEVLLTVGIDSYVGVTKIEGACGMTAPQSYGAAPVILESATYVPADMFELHGYTFSAQGQFVSFSK